MVMNNPSMYLIRRFFNNQLYRNMTDRGSLVSQINNEFIIFIRDSVSRECSQRMSLLEVELLDIKTRVCRLEDKIDR